MRAVTVYRLIYGNDTIYPTRHPIGSVLELRERERMNNFDDLLRLARRFFALDVSSAAHIVIDVRQARQSYHPESTRDFTASSPEDTTSFRMLGAGSGKW